MTTTQIVLLLLAFALLVELGIEWLHGRELAKARRMSARYPLYAVRDELVGLVASGEMEEDDPSWARMYATVNRLLRTSEHQNVLRMVWNYARFIRAVRSNEDLREEVAALSVELAQRASDVPGFRAAVEKFDSAFIDLVTRQSGWRHLLALAMLAVPFKEVRSIFLGRKPAHPNTAVVARWQGSSPDISLAPC